MNACKLTSVFATTLLMSVVHATDIAAFDVGWCNEQGNHTPTNLNYLVGFDSVNEVRNFFVFDLSDVDGEIVEASLRIYNPVDGLRTDEGVETYRVVDVSTDVETLRNGTGGVAAFDDLGSGTVLGEANALVRDINQTITVPLNADGLAALNAAEGEVALGGFLPNVNDSDVPIEYLFGFSTGTAGLARLVLRTENDPVALSAVGVRAPAVLCENLTDPQSVVVTRPEVFGLFSVDCEAAGLTVTAGDEIRLAVSGLANSTTGWLNGFATGLDDNDTFRCFNLSLGESTAWTQEAGIWDCNRSPFPFEFGATVRVVIRGVAQ
ncbi:MAG: hypothetical protein AAFX85_02455 [Pseudomonadota bacterium]